MHALAKQLKAVCIFLAILCGVCLVAAAWAILMFLMPFLIVSLVIFVLIYDPDELPTEPSDQ
jgi:hypothetical protein